MRIHKPQLRLLGYAAAADAAAYLALLAHLPLWLSAAASVVISVVVPGALLAWLLLGSSESRPTPLEWIVYGAACGFSLLSLLLLALSYLPGGLALWETQVGVGGVSLLLAVLTLIKRGDSEVAAQPTLFADGLLTRRQWRRVAAGLLVVGVLAGFFRFANIGYAEFHGDEARAVLRAAAVIQGEEDVLFLHRKPPGEILLPTAVFAYAGHINEAAARIPLALANMTALLGVLLLGWRMRGLAMGWAAMLICALDGYLVAFARFVQYQSVVLLLSVAAVLVFQRIYQDPRALKRYLIAGALFLATAVLYHWDGLLAYVPAAALLVALCCERRASWAGLWRAALPAALVAVGALALFFVPFMLQPGAAATQDYVFQSRLIGQDSILRNNILDVAARTFVYNSVYFLATLIGLVMVALVAAWQNGWDRRTALVIAPAVLVVAAAPFLWPDELIVAGVNLAIVPPLILIGGLWVVPRLSAEERALWLWFGTPLIASLFLIATPRTHVHILVVPAALLAGMMIARFWGWAKSRPQPRRVLAPAIAAGVAAVALSGGWLYLAFVDAGTEMVANWDTKKPVVYWTPAASATIDRLYGFPLNNGWKVAGALYERGALRGDYDALLGGDWISAWYLRGENRCLSTSEWYFTARGLEPWVEAPESVYDRIQSYGFTPWAGVEVLGRDSMQIFARAEATQTEALTLQLTDYEAAFDAAADPYLPLSYPVIEPDPTEALRANFGDRVILEGYDLEYPAPLRSGDSIVLTLHWRSPARRVESYKVSIQMYDAVGNFAAQNDSMPVCDRRATNVWLAGETVIDRHSIPMNDDTLPGAYPLYVILYDGATGERLRLLDADGQPLDGKLKIADLEIAARAEGEIDPGDLR